MIANQPLFFVDVVDKEYYVQIHSLRAFGANFFHIPIKTMKKAHAGLLRRRESMYRTLREMDQDFYVLIEMKPNEGFRRVIPANPKYSPSSVSTLRRQILEEIENYMLNSVRITYTLAPETSELKVFFEYPSMSGAFSQIQLKPIKQDASYSNLRSLDSGRFFILGEEEVAP